MAILQARRQARFLPFASYTPTITAGSGTFTTVSATGRWSQVGKIVFVQIIVTITTNGTAAGTVNATLPSTSNSTCVIDGRESTSTGKELAGRIASGTSAVNIVNYDNTYPGGSGTTLEISGCYETQ